MKSTVFWDMALCCPLEVNRGFGGNYRLPDVRFMCLMFDGQTRAVVVGGGFGRQFYRASYASQFSALLAGTSLVFTAACFSVAKLQLFGYTVLNGWLYSVSAFSFLFFFWGEISKQI
jgi:hypothetical protein